MMMSRTFKGLTFTGLLAAAPLLWLSHGMKVAAQDGRTVYERSCAACHGDRGQGRLAPALVPFTRGSQELLRIVRAGAGTMMNGFSAAEVSDADVQVNRALPSRSYPGAGTQAGTRTRAPPLPGR